MAPSRARVEETHGRTIVLAGDIDPSGPPTIAKLRKTKPEAAAAVDGAATAIFDAFEGRILPVDRAVATTWGEALGDSEKHVDDTRLAATARVHGLIVVTRNTKDFKNRGVKLLDPFKAAREHRR